MWNIDLDPETGGKTPKLLMNESSTLWGKIFSTQRKARAAWVDKHPANTIFLVFKEFMNERLKHPSPEGVLVFFLPSMKPTFS